MLSPGTILQQRYRIKRELARGGMGAVYEAEAIHLRNALVAVKETFFHAHQWKEREQFEREAAMLARLRHPALPQIKDHFHEGNGQFLVMEFIAGDDLGVLLDKQLRAEGKPFDWSLVMEWADQLLDALAYIHAQPVIHRDIKPGNLKLTPEGELFLIDFGLAKETITPSRLRGVIGGYTPAYASPEQIKKTGTDGRTDLFSLAATLYHLLTGELPAHAELRDEAVHRQAMRDPLRPADEVYGQVPPALAAVLHTALAFDREQRYPDAATMRVVLRQARQSIEAEIAERQRLEEERRRREEAERQRRAEEERQRREAEERKRREEEARQQREEAERKRREEEERKRREAEERRQTQLAEIEQEEAEINRKRDELAKRKQALRGDAKRERRKLPAIIGGAALAVAVLGGIAWQQLNGAPDSSANPPTTPPASIPAPTSSATAPAPVEVLRFRQEYEPGAGKNGFRFHFTARTDGYLYLIAPDEKKRPLALLTNRPAAEMGVSANQLTAGREFAFPSGEWLGLSEDADFTLLFAPVKLTSGFLSTPEVRVLTAAELRALDELRRQSSARVPKVAANGDGGVITALNDGRAPVVIVITARRK